ncbi:phosphatase PAP2 family protein [Sporobolomyces salmoneus]|uniref:phosphatase PAP2 family protein n=1 Tax=Sporobolomyces salmoneus TaxID=183962 RepID=UPI00317698A7
MTTSADTSLPPSRSPSPPLEIQRTRSRSVSSNEKTPDVKSQEVKLKDGAVGRLQASFYRKILPGWRCAVREYLVESLEGEIDDLVQLQTSWRTRFRDHYFVKTSLLGTHTFFMIFIPIWAWYGFPEVARGLLYVLAAGGYVTSVLKDAFCVPRPFSPPVHRLSVGSHALEYGFPSTHSSNALSMAFFFGELLLRRNWNGNWIINLLGVIALIGFAWSITFGRLYTGMHSKMDVKVGSSIGVFVWLVTSLGEAKLERLVRGTGLNGTLFIVPALLLLVTFHPQPAENCPCFEDAIAFLSVFAGILSGVAWNPYQYADNTLGHEWRDISEIGLWSAAVGAKLFLGISSILVWRIIAKFLCHKALPPLFRLFAPVFALPRRYYLAATEYGSYPEQKSLNAVPSILDLPSLAEDAEISIPSSSSTSTSLAPGTHSTQLHQRAGGPQTRQSSTDSQTSTNSPSTPTFVVNNGSAALPHLRVTSITTTEDTKTGGTETPVHLDADVLTKIIVYAGIGLIATVTLPWMFGGLGLSVWKRSEWQASGRWTGKRLGEKGIVL